MKGLAKALVISIAWHGAMAVAAQPRVFMTSTTGTGDLSTWPDAHGANGLAAADEICRTRAAAASIENADEYVAWLSDSNNDAYCRAHGLQGLLFGDSCGQTHAPTGAGPWYRMDGLPAMDVLPNAEGMFDHVEYRPRHILYDEYAHEIPQEVDFQPRADLAFTGSYSEGTYDGSLGSCLDWKSANSSLRSSGGSAYWVFLEDVLNCGSMRRLVCLQSGQHGPPIEQRTPPTARRAFVTSSMGSGNLSTWKDASGAVGLVAADAVCKAHAARAELPLPETYKAWLSTTSTDARTRFSFDGSWYLTDGVRLASSMADLTSGVIQAPLQLDESGQPVGHRQIWTGSNPNGTHTDLTCVSWTSAEEEGGTDGFAATANHLWGSDPIGGSGCSGPLHLYCLADNDSLFMAGFER